MREKPGLFPPTLDTLLWAIVIAWLTLIVIWLIACGAIQGKGVSVTETRSVEALEPSCIPVSQDSGGRIFSYCNHQQSMSREGLPIVEDVVDRNSMEDRIDAREIEILERERKRAREERD
jgi:hypothetical protein